MAEPQIDEREEALTAMLAAWPDIEDELLRDDKSAETAAAVKRAFRVEAHIDSQVLQLYYVLLFNVADPDARKAAAFLDDNPSFRIAIRRRTPGLTVSPRVKLTNTGRPVEGEVCPRVMVTPPGIPDLRELPIPRPPTRTYP